MRKNWQKFIVAATEIADAQENSSMPHQVKQQKKEKEDTGPKESDKPDKAKKK